LAAEPALQELLQRALAQLRVIVEQRREGIAQLIAGVEQVGLSDGVPGMAAGKAANGAPDSDAATFAATPLRRATFAIPATVPLAFKVFEEVLGRQRTFK